MQKQIVLFVLLLFSIASRAQETSVKKQLYPYKQTVSVSKFRTSVDGGWAYLLNSLSDDANDFEREFNQKLKNGIHWGVDNTFFIFESLGIGISFNQITTSHSADNVYLNYWWNTGTLRSKVKVNFLGLGLANRLYDRKYKNQLFFRVSFGYFDYKGEMTFKETNIVEEGGSWGFNTEIGYDWQLSENWYLGLKGAIHLASLKELDREEGSKSEHIELETDEYLSLSHANISICMSYMR